MTGDEHILLRGMDDPIPVEALRMMWQLEAAGVEIRVVEKIKGEYGRCDWRIQQQLVVDDLAALTPAQIDIINRNAGAIIDLVHYASRLALYEIKREWTPHDCEEMEP